jgi:putative membrane protein
MMDWGDGGGWAWSWMALMMLFVLVITGAVIWGVIAVVRSATTSSGQPARPTAEDILNERFARGEIDVSEYRERIDALRARPNAKT